MIFRLISISCWLFTDCAWQWRDGQLQSCVFGWDWRHRSYGLQTGWV